MHFPGWLAVAPALIPLAAFLYANRSTSLIHAAGWTLAAWAVWIVALASGSMSWTYLALGLTGCAGVAVFGARWPGAGAWNLVVGGLLVVLALPLAEAGALNTPIRPGTIRTVFLASLIGITVINYLPTRLAAGAGLLAVGCGLALGRSAGLETNGNMAGWCVGLAPWAAWFGLLIRADTGSVGDRLWRRFRDRFGLVWSLRLRDQFNRAAANAGLNCELRWTGLRPDSPAAYELLVALIRRFVVLA
jgi:hypothetical protein